MSFTTAKCIGGLSQFQVTKSNISKSKEALIGRVLDRMRAQYPPEVRDQVRCALFWTTGAYEEGAKEMCRILQDLRDRHGARAGVPNTPIRACIGAAFANADAVMYERWHNRVSSALRPGDPFAGSH